MPVFIRGRQAERDLVDNLNDLDDDAIVLALDGVTANTTLVVPGGYRISSLDLVETAGGTVTGGLRVGTAAAGADVVAAAPVTANSVTTADLLKNLFSATAPQTLYLEAVTAWAGASLRVRATLEQVFEG